MQFRAFREARARGKKRRRTSDRSYVTIKNALIPKFRGPDRNALYADRSV